MDRSLDAIIAERPVRSQHIQSHDRDDRKKGWITVSHNGLLTRIHSRSRTVVVALKVAAVMA
jgi:hypothetical protein